MIVKATWEFDVDVSDLDPKFVDISGLAEDLARREMQVLIASQELHADDFEYTVSSNRVEFTAESMSCGARKENNNA